MALQCSTCTCKCTANSTEAYVFSSVVQYLGRCHVALIHLRSFLPVSFPSNTKACIQVKAVFSLSVRCAFTCFHIQIPILLCILRQQLPQFSICILLLLASTTPSIMPILSVRMAEGSLKFASAMVKAHRSALLTVPCTSYSASSVPQIAHHGSSSFRSRTAPLQSHKPHLFLKLLSMSHQSPLIAEAFYLLSQDLDVSDIHFCLQCLLHAQFSPHWKYNISPLSIHHWMTLFSFHMTLRHLACCFCPFSTLCKGRTCVFRNFRFAALAVFAVHPVRVVPFFSVLREDLGSLFVRLVLPSICGLPFSMALNGSNHTPSFQFFNCRLRCPANIVACLTNAFLMSPGHVSFISLCHLPFIELANLGP